MGAEDHRPYAGRAHQRLQRLLHPLAIQGPRAAETLQKLTSTDLSTIKNYWFTWGQVCGLHNVMIARTGYTVRMLRDLHSFGRSNKRARMERGARGWVRSSAFWPADSERGIRFVWKPEWRCMGMRFQIRLTSSRLILGVTRSLRSRILWAVRRCSRFRLQEGRSESWSVWR